MDTTRRSTRARRRMVPHILLPVQPQRPWQVNNSNMRQGTFQLAILYSTSQVRPTRRDKLQPAAPLMPHMPIPATRLTVWYCHHPKVMTTTRTAKSNHHPRSADRAPEEDSKTDWHSGPCVNVRRPICEISRVASSMHDSPHVTWKPRMRSSRDNFSM